jgi:predicted Rossmann-fold nucleotide-binding protein
LIKKIISGGQTGVDRAALDVALELGIPCGGWCPKGRLAEDGSIDSQYPLKETDSSEYEERTEKNVKDSDGTLILTWGAPTGGTAFTIKMAEKHKKPYLVIDLSKNMDSTDAVNWIKAQGIALLNVAGPRETKAPGINKRANAFLHQALKELSLKG